MTWTTAEVLAWVGELETRRASMSLFEVLGVTATATELGAAFHRLASGAHPDQHRLALTPVDMERLVRA